MSVGQLVIAATLARKAGAYSMASGAEQQANGEHYVWCR
jgi:hypothetical protein